MKGKNISIALLTIIVYEIIAQLPLLNKSGGGDIASDAFMEIFVYLHFIVLLIIFIISFLRKKVDKDIVVQLLFVLSIIVCIIIWHRIQWYQLPKEERDKILQQEQESKNAMYTVHCPNGKYRFQNYKEEIIIPCLYDDVNLFEKDSITGVKVGDKWGFINRTGKVLIPFQFDKADNFYEGLAAVRQNRLWGFIDLKGNWVIKPKYDFIQSSFRNGKAYGKIGNEIVVILK